MKMPILAQCFSSVSCRNPKTKLAVSPLTQPLPLPLSLVMEPIVQASALKHSKHFKCFECFNSWVQDSSPVSFWPQHSEQHLSHGGVHRKCLWNELKPHKHAGPLGVSVSWSLVQGQRPGQPLTPRHCLALRPWVAETPLASSNYLMPPGRLAHRTGLPRTHCQKVYIKPSSSRKFSLIATSTGHLPVSAR